MLRTNLLISDINRITMEQPLRCIHFIKIAYRIIATFSSPSQFPFDLIRKFLEGDFDSE